MTEAEYWRAYDIIRDEINAAIVSCYTHRAIHHLAANDMDILERMNRSAEFWNVTTFSLQNTLFIVLNRILDTDPALHSIHKVLNATTANPQFFAHAALRARKVAISGAAWDKAFLDEYVARAWEPTAPDLREFKKALRPHKTTFDAIYRPIRDQIAHIIHTDAARIADLYSRTQKTHIDELLCFLHTVIKAIWDLAYNGGQPRLQGDHYGFREEVERITRETEAMLRRIP